MAYAMSRNRIMLVPTVFLFESDKSRIPNDLMLVPIGSISLY